MSATSIDTVYPFLPPDNLIYVRRFGINQNVSSMGYETIWTAGGLYPWQQITQELFIASDDGADNGQAWVGGFASDASPLSALATIAGQTPVSIGEFFEVDRGFALAPFTGTVRVGLQPFTAGVPDTILLELEHSPEAPGGASKQCLVTIPKGFQGAVIQLIFSARANSDVLLWISHPDAGGAEWEFEHRVSENGNQVTMVPSIPISSTGIVPVPEPFPKTLSILPAGTRIEARAKAQMSSDEVACSFDMWLKKL